MSAQETPIGPSPRRAFARLPMLQRRSGGRRAVLAAALFILGCAPVVRPPEFLGSREKVTGSSLFGPFDGQIIDGANGEPIRDAVVVGVWSYDRGDGFVGPHGSETVAVRTDEAGRYRIPTAPRKLRGTSLRLVSFHLVAYKRGYVGYRSDTLFDGGPRRDFVVRHNEIALRKWKEADSHADHLLFLAPPRDVMKASRWERDLANAELYKRLGGDVAVELPGAASGTGGGGEAGGGPAASSEPQWLDASALLPPEEVAKRTGDTDPFEIGDLPDLARTEFYHGVVLQAVERDATYDITFRVWSRPPDGLDPVIETFEATLPDVPRSTEVTPETWVVDGESQRIVAFIDREADAAVLLTCGVDQCTDISTAIVLAKVVAERLSELRLVSVEDALPQAPAPASSDEETPPPQEAEEAEGEAEDEAEDEAGDGEETSE